MGRAFVDHREPCVGAFVPGLLRRCFDAAVLASVCVAMFVAALSFFLGIIGGLLNEASNALALLADWIHNRAARRRRD